MLVIVGTDIHPFDRLMGWLERWYAARADRPRLRVQHGSSRVPLVPGASAYLAHDELTRAMREALLVVSHGGPATISEARRSGHLPIVVPRDPARAEHVDDHQLRFARRLACAGAVRLCESERAFAATLDRGLAEPAAFTLDREGDGARAARAETADPGRPDRGGPRRRPPPSRRPAVATMTNLAPTVSAVVPTRDRPELLRAALAAIRAQDYPGRIEVLVVHDRCEPATWPWS